MSKVLNVSYSLIVSLMMWLGLSTVILSLTAHMHSKFVSVHAVESEFKFSLLGIQESYSSFMMLGFVVFGIGVLARLFHGLVFEEQWVNSTVFLSVCSLLLLALAGYVVYAELSGSVVSAVSDAEAFRDYYTVSSLGSSVSAVFLIGASVAGSVGGFLTVLCGFLLNLMFKGFHLPVEDSAESGDDVSVPDGFVVESVVDGS